MELPLTFNRSRLNPSKKSGFTLIEMALVLGIVCLVATTSIAFSAPALSDFACRQEVQVLILAFERARHISQFLKQGDVKIQINAENYEILRRDPETHHFVFVESIARHSQVPVVANEEIVFQEESARMLSGNVEINIGDEDFSCRKKIMINDVGALQ